MNNTRYSQALGVVTMLGVFVFFTAMFSVPSGYSYGAGILLVASGWFFTSRPHLTLDAEDYMLVVVLVGYFVVAVGMTLWLANNPKDIDQYSRALLAAPILVLLLGVRGSLPVMWAAIVLGTVLSAPLAWWQVVVKHDTQAGGFMNEISFSNLTLVCAAFCIAGMFWAAGQGRRTVVWRIAFVLGILAGLYSTVVGGSRGSWVAAVPIAVLYLVTFWSRRKGWMLILWLAVALGMLAVVFAWPKSPLQVRYQEGVVNVTRIDKGDMANSIGARLEIDKGALVNLHRHPLAGWNMHDYSAALQAQVDAGSLSPVALRYTDNLHNNYLQAWVFTGLPGLLALLALYGVPLWNFGRRLRDMDMTVRVLAFCGTSLVVSFVCFSLTYSALRRNYGIMFYVISLVILWAAMRHAQRDSLNRPERRS